MKSSPLVVFVNLGKCLSMFPKMAVIEVQAGNSKYRDTAWVLQKVSQMFSQATSEFGIESWTPLIYFWEINCKLHMMHTSLTFLKNAALLKSSQRVLPGHRKYNKSDHFLNTAGFWFCAVLSYCLEIYIVYIIYIVPYPQLIWKWVKHLLWKCENQSLSP